MRSAMLVLCLILAILLPIDGNAQVTYRPTPSPQITAANAAWQINGEPIFFAGSFYYPTGPTVFFDGQLMARVGEYLTVPLYADTTLEAFSRVYVSIGGAVMKPYERRRAGPLAGTVGSTTPSWPVQVASNTLQTYGGVGNQSGEPLVIADVARPSDSAVSAAPPLVATSGDVAALPELAQRTGAQSIPRPLRNTGISITFQGTQWFADGPAVTFNAERFVPFGDYRGFPVYRDQRATAETIYVTVVPGGALARYSRR